jgi:hypothetical protein
MVKKQSNGRIERPDGLYHKLKKKKKKKKNEIQEAARHERNHKCARLGE